MKVWELIILLLTLLCWLRAYYIYKNDLELDEDNPLDFMYGIIISLLTVFTIIYFISLKINWEFLNYTII